MLAVLGSCQSIKRQERTESKQTEAPAVAQSQAAGYARWLLTPEQASTEFRGGTTRGTAVTLDSTESDPWKALAKAKKASANTKKTSGKADSEAKGSDDQYELDRLAILAMQGPYRASFEFLETVAWLPEYTLDKPYRSWGTEYVFVAEERPNFISLQHVMVMFYWVEGVRKGPMVMKHWRQDWRYEAKEYDRFLGHQTWERQQESEDVRKGLWTQVVYQVDDSPRYAAQGRWRHYPEFSVWESDDRARRPLPRREYSVRQDYQALEGRHRITIQPDGWTHEQDSIKLALAPPPSFAVEKRLAREAGLNRYARIKDFDFEPGRDYWLKTQSFWAEVRRFWQEVPLADNRFSFVKKRENRFMFMVLFQYADDIHKGRVEFSRNATRKFLDRELRPFLSSSKP